MIQFDKGLKIKDYQEMINARDENLESKRKEIKELRSFIREININWFIIVFMVNISWFIIYILRL